MGQVSITVNGRDYQIACDDGEEEHLSYLAKYIKHHVDDLVQSIGQVGEARLILMAALIMADELSEAYTELDEARARLDGKGASAGAEREATAAADIEGLAERLEGIAARVENS